MPTSPQMDAAMAQVGYNVVETLGRAIATFTFGINPVSLGATIGTALGSYGSASPWRRHDRTVVHQN